ncbi:MAG TPA: lipopolysaccharide kinase InaA family protein, partial [Thermoanaerobaculia bacterium]|nr:lipopolysaccharide kinase InaA family protein [Thermoanaerobaculia bacterium]
KQFRGGGPRERLRRARGEARAARSWRAARAMVAAGLPTPEPVMLLESLDPRGPSFYVSRAVEGAIEARYLFRAANAGEERDRFPEVDFGGFLEELGRTVRRLHEAGFWHRDVSAGNVLVRAGKPPELWLLDLNRARRRRRLTLSQRTRDLSRLPLFRPQHRAAFLQAYWGAAPGALARSLYLTDHYAFRWKHQVKNRLRGAGQRVKRSVLPRRAHAHIPPPPESAAARDRVVWDRLSDQPHQHAGRLAKIGVRLADARDHLEEGTVIAAALPRVLRRYRALARELYTRPEAWGGVGVALRPWPADPDALLAAVEELGVRHLLLRLHPWETDHAAEEALARELAARGHDLAFALPQNRDLVRDPERWRAAVEELAARFTPYGRRFQVGQAINRSKWGVWSLREYAALAETAGEALRRYPGVEVLGPAVIDFEPHVTAAALNLRRPGLRFDVVTALLYVDRRGAPENAQAGFDTPRKLALLKAIAETSRNGSPRCWVTEVNWPLREGPHSPAGKGVAVGEEAQADYLARYYLLALASGLAERVYWWQLVAKGYGLLDTGAEPGGGLRRRPAFRALATLARTLAGCRFERRLPGPPGAWLLLFSRPDGSELVAAWSAAGPAVGELPRPTAAVLSRDGQPLPAPGAVRVQLDASPRYLLLA